MIVLMVMCLSKCQAPDPLTECIFSFIHIVLHRRVFMFQFWKPITWWRVPSSSSATVWVFSKDSRWLRMLLLRPICTLPLLISVPWYTLFNYPCTCSAGFDFPTEVFKQPFQACCYKKRDIFEFPFNHYFYHLYNILYWKSMLKSCFMMERLK